MSIGKTLFGTKSVNEHDDGTKTAEAEPLTKEVMSTEKKTQAKDHAATANNQKTDQLGTMPDRQQLIDHISRLQTIQKAQSAASSLRQQAETIADPTERERLLKEAYNKEVEARGLSKLAKRMQSGTWQGMAGGAGIGGVLSVGLGGVVGTLVGGILAVPSVGLGALIGSGVGALHGPFIKLGNGKEKKFEDASPEEVVDAIGREQQEAQEKGEAVSTQPSVEAGPLSGSDQNLSPVQVQERRRPRKIQIRSQVNVKEGSPASGESARASPDLTPLPRKPRKIEVRSQAGSAPVQQ